MTNKKTTQKEIEKVEDDLLLEFVLCLTIVGFSTSLNLLLYLL